MVDFPSWYFFFHRILLKLLKNSLNFTKSPCITLIEKNKLPTGHKRASQLLNFLLSDQKHSHLFSYENYNEKMKSHHKLS